LKQILQYKNDEDRTILLSKSEPVDRKDAPDGLKQMFEDLAFHVKGDPKTGRRCWGLSGVQIGHLYRIMCMQYGNELIYIANPVIVRTYGEPTLNSEGCSSILYGSSNYWVKRFNIVKVKAVRVTFDGDKPTFRVSLMKEHGLYAAILQHEIDHMEGITLFERTTMGPISKLEKGKD
jgi:peptide deformylase